MVSVSWFVRAWFMLVVGLAAALPAAAQSDRGEYQIVQARYGTEAHNVDVTQRLKELARQDSRLKVTNSMFGVDPDIGAHKTLRIFARGPDGEVRMFEYEERSYIEGSQFTSWSGGDWQQQYVGNGGAWSGPTMGNMPRAPGDRGEYQILHARYGTAAHNIDVTDRLKELARGDTQFRVTNATFRDDPDVGAKKTLRIFARDTNGSTQTMEYSEGGLVDGAVFTGWNGGNWGYGANRGNWDGGVVNNPPGDQGAWQILQARYGTAAHNIDVTNLLRDMARRDNRIAVTNATFGDPDVGRHKTLRIYARGRDGTQRMFEYGERDTVDGATFTGWNGGNWGNGARDARWEGYAPR